MNWGLSSVSNVVNLIYNQNLSNTVQNIIPFVNRRVDDLYRFIHAWVPSLYGELDENYWRERGYVLLDTDTDLSPELSPHEAGKAGEATEEEKCRQDSDEISELTRESWEKYSTISCGLSDRIALCARARTPKAHGDPHRSFFIAAEG